eukprot:scaffold20934_cov63-Skeletonema_menzelii.AAC.1
MISRVPNRTDSSMEFYVSMKQSFPTTQTETQLVRAKISKEFFCRSDMNSDVHNQCYFLREAERWMIAVAGCSPPWRS